MLIAVDQFVALGIVLCGVDGDLLGVITVTI